MGIEKVGLGGPNGAGASTILKFAVVSIYIVWCHVDGAVLSLFMPANIKTRKLRTKTGCAEYHESSNTVAL